jgi:ArsR family transcriptional regulator, arsenate/arsenite/antimonite-responsive transcriptional repressor
MTGALPDLRPVEGVDADRDLAHLAKALGHPGRVTIVRLLRMNDGRTCAQLVRELGLAQSTVSEHLRFLREAGLVRLSDGRYHIDVHRVRRFKAVLGSL